MSKEQALAILEQAAAQARLSRQEHEMILQAVKVLKDLINEKAKGPN